MFWESKYDFGFLPWNLSRGVAINYSLERLWACFRSGERFKLDNTEENDEFLALQQSSDVELWKWASREQLMQRHPLTGDTTFHLLCRTNKLTTEQKLAVLADLRAHRRNPLTPNYRNELCTALTNDAEVKKALEEYMGWRPKWWVTEWFGPCFRERARTLLLVCCRMKAEHPKRMNKDIRHLLVKYLSKVEHIYVPTVISDLDQ
jgi:hypothetical protein